MKLAMSAVASAVFALSLSVHAEDMQGMKMDSGGHRDEAGYTTGSSCQCRDAVGTIKAIDTMVTISHGAVPTGQSPPMTMAFSVTEHQLTGLADGDRVSFSFRLDGGKAVIVSAFAGTECNTAIELKHQTVFDFRRSYVNTDHFRDLSTPINASRTWPAGTFSLTKTLDQFFAQFPDRPRIDGVVDRFAAGVGFFKINVHKTQLARDLLGRKAFSEQWITSSKRSLPMISFLSGRQVTRRLRVDA